MKQKGRVWKFGDDINTDLIIPGKYLELVDPEEMANHAMEGVDPDFNKKVKEGDIIVGGKNFGCGSSREHAAIAPKYLGLKAVIVKSFARIHLANLVNFGIVPLTFENKDDYNKIDQGDKFEIDLTTLQTGKVKLKNVSKNVEISLTHSLSETEIDVLKAGGKLPHIKQKHT